MEDEKLLPVDCNELQELMPDAETVKALNRAVTDPLSLVDRVTEQDLEGKDVGDDFDVGVEGIPAGALPELEVSREEDYYRLREEGQLEILLEEIMPRECSENSDGVWLTAVLMSRIAENQIFGEGNKRTSYLTGVLFLRNIQISAGFEEALIPDLNRELTRLLSDVAIQNAGEVPEDGRDLERDTGDLDNYLRKGLRKYLEQN